MGGEGLFCLWWSQEQCRFLPEVDLAEANSGSGSVSAQVEKKESTGALDAVPISDATADEKVNKWNQEHARLVPSFSPPPVSSAATEL